MNTNLSCINADKQKEVFDNLCKDKWDKKLQSKFGEYAVIECETKATEDGGESYLTFGIYYVQDELVNFSEELAEIIGSSKNEAKTLIEKYIEIFNITVNVEWSERLKTPIIEIFLDEPYIDEDTESDDLRIIKNEEKLLISEKLANCICTFVDKLMHDANVEFGYKWNEWNTCNPE